MFCFNLSFGFSLGDSGIMASVGDFLALVGERFSWYFEPIDDFKLVPSLSSSLRPGVAAAFDCQKWLQIQYY